MSRDISAANASALADRTIRPILMVRMEFGGLGTVGVHSATQQIIYDGVTYLGVGHYGSISDIKESSELQRNTVTFVLTGIPASGIDWKQVALTDAYQGEDVRVYLGFLSEGFTLVNAPTQIMRGRMDFMTVEIGQSATVSLTVENRLADWDRARIRRYTNADQQLKHPDDKGLEFVDQMVDKELSWGYRAAS